MRTPTKVEKSPWFARPSSRRSLRKNLANNATVHVGKADISSAEPMREALVIYPQKVEQGGVEIVNLERIDGGLVAPLVGGTVANAGADSASCHPEAEPMLVVIAACPALRKWGASEFA